MKLCGSPLPLLRRACFESCMPRTLTRGITRPTVDWCLRSTKVPDGVSTSLLHLFVVACRQWWGGSYFVSGAGKDRADGLVPGSVPAGREGDLWFITTFRWICRHFCGRRQALSANALAMVMFETRTPRARLRPASLSRSPPVLPRCTGQARAWRHRDLLHLWGLPVCVMPQTEPLPLHELLCMTDTPSPNLPSEPLPSRSVRACRAEPPLPATNMSAACSPAEADTFHQPSFSPGMTGMPLAVRLCDLKPTPKKALRNQIAHPRHEQTSADLLVVREPRRVGKGASLHYR